MILTSNNTRELSEALKRRCLYLHIDYPDLEREKEIVLTKVPDITENLADQVARIVRSIRQLELKKAPSVSETTPPESSTAAPSESSTAAPSESSSSSVEPSSSGGDSQMMIKPGECGLNNG